MKIKKRNYFTLLELVAALLIMALLVGATVQSGVFTSKRVTLVQCCDSFQEFVATVRRQAMATPQGMKIIVDQDNVFIGMLVNEDGKLEEPEFAPKWTHSDEITMSYETLDEDNTVINYYPDGSGSANDIGITFKELEFKFYISPLTGFFLPYPEEEEDL